MKKRTNSQKGKMSRTKGNSFERDIASLFTEKFGGEFKRTPLSGGWSKKHKECLGDIICPEEFPFIIECKNRETVNLSNIILDEGNSWFLEWWEGLKAMAKSVGKEPLLIMKRNRMSPVCIMDLSKFEDVVGLYNPSFNFFISNTRKIAMIPLDNFIIIDRNILK